MKEVKTQKRYKCDFCKKRSTKSVMTLHEKRCFRNPNRFCDFCENNGHTTEEENGCRYEVPCPYCSRRNPEIEEAIKKYETLHTPSQQ